MLTKDFQRDGMSHTQSNHKFDQSKLTGPVLSATSMYFEELREDSDPPEFEDGTGFPNLY